MDIKIKKIYVDTSDIGEVKQKKLDDNITIGYDENDNIVGIEINNPIGLDIDDNEVIVYETLETILKTQEVGYA